jgi:hypothetical protein
VVSKARYKDGRFEVMIDGVVRVMGFEETKSLLSRTATAAKEVVMGKGRWVKILGRGREVSSHLQNGSKNAGASKIIPPRHTPTMARVSGRPRNHSLRRQ